MKHGAYYIPTFTVREGKNHKKNINQRCLFCLQISENPCDDAEARKKKRKKE